MTEKYLTPEELADHLRVRPSAVLRWAREGRIPSIRISERVTRFDLKAVLAALAADARPPRRGEVCDGDQ